MKTVKVEWCENFIKSAFAKIPFENGGIEIGCFWKMAEKSGLWVQETYGTPMSEALAKLTRVEAVLDKNGRFLYHVFRLQKQYINTMKKAALWKEDPELGVAFFCPDCKTFICASGKCDCGTEVDLNLPKIKYEGKVRF